MRGRIRSRLTYANVMATLALIIAMTGGTAYAINEWTGANIVDASLTTADYRNNNIRSVDVRDDSFPFGGLTGADITNGALTGADISDNTIGVNDIGSQQVASDEVLNDSLLQSDIRAGAVTGDEVLDNSLTGADINESTLSTPPSTTATFAAPPGAVAISDAFTKIVGRNLPAGSYAVIATANIRSFFPFAGDQIRDTACELRNGAGFIGGATDRRVIPNGDNVRVSLSMNGGAQVPGGGGEVSLWCRYQGGNAEFVYGQMMIIRLDGFF